jgi:hypothetical protein
MHAPDVIGLFVGPLNRLELRYMATGGVATILYSEPRLTHDIDLVLALAAGDAERLHDAFDEAEFYVPPLEVLRLESQRARHGHFNLYHHETAFRADFYLVGEDPLNQEAMARRRRMDTASGPIWVAPPEYVIARKLQYRRDGGSDRHLRDVRAIVAHVGNALDREALHTLIDQLGVRAQWDEVERSRRG